MDIFEYAMKMEKDGEAYYNEMARRTDDKGLKSILSILANDEVKHYRTLEAMKKDEKPGMADTEVLSGARNIFTEMKEKNLNPDVRLSQRELWEKALDIEHRSEKFYRDKSGEMINPTNKELLLRIAEEEKKHIFLIENIIEFITRPKQWVENAEFHHLDEY